MSDAVGLGICGEIKELHFAQERRIRIAKGLGTTRGREVTLVV